MDTITKRFFSLFVLLVTTLSVTFGQDVPPIAGRLAATSETEPASTDERFVAGSGSDFDKYLFRRDRPNGRLTFQVDVTRYYSNLMQFDAQGFPTNASELINKGLLPKQVRLTMRVYDVDHNSQYDGNGDGVADPEIDYVYVNNRQVVTSSGNPWLLGSGNDTWSTPSILIPIEYIKFPTKTGDATTLPRATNTIQIDVDVSNTTYWAVQCDWLSFEIENTIRPLVLIRGYGLSSGGIWADNAQKTWQTFGGFLKADGIPFHIAESIDACGSIFTNAGHIADEITIAQKTFGVQRVNIIGHSKGGLDARAYLRTGSAAETLVQLGTPNHGSGAAYAPVGCFDARQNLIPAWLARNFNYRNEDINQPLYKPEQLNTRIFQLASTKDIAVTLERATLPQRATYIDDVSSPVNIANDGAYAVSHGDLRQNNSVYRRAIQLITNKVRTSGGRVSTQTNNVAVPDTLAMIFAANFQLDASANQFSRAYVPLKGVAYFQVSFLDPKTEISLKSPSGKMYTASSSEFTTEEGFGSYIATYTLESAENGYWEITLKGGPTAGPVAVRGYAASFKKLSVKLNKYAFTINEPVSITASLTTKGIPETQATGIAYFFNGNAKDSLQLFDDGLHNDEKANDGLYGNKYPGSSDSKNISMLVKLQKGPESIFKEDAFIIYNSTGEFSSTYKERVVDLTGDNLYDSLQIKVGVKVKKAGNFLVTGTLRDAQNKFITTASWSNVNSKPLAIGTYDVNLNFSGDAIGNNGLSGPFLLTDLNLIDLGNSTVVDSRSKAYTTQAYSINLFPRPPLELTGKNTVTPVDTDQDGDFDYLDIKLQVKVNLSGNYTVSAELTDSLQNSLNWTNKSLNLLAGTTEIVLRFDGQEINEKLSNGPYTLTNVYFYNSNASITFNNVLRTDAYSFSNFTGNYITGIVRDKLSGAVLADATVILKGAKLATTKTDTKGTYTIAGLPNGQYTIQAVKANFCSSTIVNVSKPQSLSSIELTIIPNKISLSSTKTAQFCKGDSLQVGVPGLWQSYKWSNGSSSAKITIKATGTYFVKTSLQGCDAVSDTLTVNVTETPRPTIKVESTLFLTASAAESYQWLKDNQLIQGAALQSYTATTQGTYAVRVAIKNCFNTSDPVTIIITAVSNDLTPKLLIYPNPSSDFLTVSYESIEKNVKLMNVNIYSLLGVKVSEYTLIRTKPGTWEGAIPIKFLPAGNYYLRLDRGNGNVISKPFMKVP